MGKRSWSIARMLLVPLLCVVLVQGLLPFATLLASGTRETLQNNTIELDNRMVENRKVMLEGSMVDQWSAIQKESSYMTATLKSVLEDYDASMPGFLASREMQQEYSRRIFSEMFDYVRRDTSSGVFLILANATDIAQPSQSVGFFLRDSDPTSKTETNSDIYLERGDKTLARSADITLDSAWLPTFSFSGYGTAEVDSYYYEPYKAALDNPKADVSNLGYWSLPFVLEGSAIDNHQMITYSVPLKYDGVVYGVLGTELSTSYLINSYFSVQDLDRDLNAGYALAVKDDDDEAYRFIMGSGALYDTVNREGDSFTFSPTSSNDFYQVDNVTEGGKGIYAVFSGLKLYSSNVPYENADWTLVALVSESSVYDLGNAVYRGVFTTITLCLLLGMAVMFVVVRQVANPVRRLMESVRGGIEGLRSFVPSNIREIDELHEVVQNLTEHEIESASELLEEKERYRIAVESSSDVFFTYRDETRTIEIVNSGGFDGVWPRERFAEAVSQRFFSSSSRDKLKTMVEGDDSSFSMQLPVCGGDGDSRWIEIHASRLSDEKSSHRGLVGYIRDITAQKRLELDQSLKQSLDPLTSFYRIDAGVDEIRRSRAVAPAGTMVLVDICSFSQIVRDFGITFGDVVLEDFSQLISLACEAAESGDTVRVRAGSDSFLVWLGGAIEQECAQALDGLRAEFASLVRKGVIDLRFRAAVVAVSAGDDTLDAVHEAQFALDEARESGETTVRHRSVISRDVAPKPFSDIVSMGYVHQMNLSSLALNLLDRRFSLAAGLDLLARRMRDAFGLSNLVVTSFSDDYLVTTVLYAWHPVSDDAHPTSVYRCSEEDYAAFGRGIALRALHPIEQSLAARCLFTNRGEEPPAGIAFSLCEEGKYSGGVIMAGIDEAYLHRSADANVLWEVATIIQNRINQEHLDQSAQAKADFLTRMSHEIRTPMNGIIGMTDIALREGQSEERRVDCLKKVSSSSRYLLGLLNDILDMSKIESGKMSLVEADFDLRGMLSSMRTVLESKFAEKRQTYHEEIDLVHDWFVGDELRLNQVLINFLGNATKYSDPGTAITLRVVETPLSENASEVLFAVEDEGVGIDEEDQKRIFRKFEQVDTTSARQQGTGLGLAICNRLVRMMGSSIELESEPGQGSTFSFTLRLNWASARIEAKNEPKDSPDFTGLRVLLAEDNELNTEIACALLGELGFVVDAVSNGAKAVEAFENSPEGYYAAIVMDVMMPVMDGLEAARTIRGLRRSDAGSIYIVAASANAFDEDVARSLACGMNAHLSKPIEPEKLAAALSAIAR